jgi:hypothetical protein
MRPIRNGSTIPTARTWASTDRTRDRSTPNWGRCLPQPENCWRGDPVGQKAAWRVKYPVIEGGGVFDTRGNLVFQGRADGVLAAYRATDGKQLLAFEAGTGIMAPPVTYAVDGVQYVSVIAGWGGSAGLFNFPGNGPVKPLAGYSRSHSAALRR